ncbi:MAG: hypothetical protein QXQ95_08740 [Thermofilum sp.]|uniref:hypothetical protein n=1 Tax=Thermofilum sp. TaxID=1961369 RepID=UPI0031821752
MSCRELLKGEVKNLCDDYKNLRRWIMCRSWELIRKGEAVSFKEAIRRAWSEAKEACTKG